MCICCYCKKRIKNKEDLYMLENEYFENSRIYCSKECAENEKIDLVNYLYLKIEEFENLEVVKL